MAFFHPLLFLLIGLVAAAELGLVAYLTHDYETRDSGYPSSRYRSLIILFLFNSAWTVLFAFAYVMFILRGSLSFLGSIGGSAIWLIITAILWGVATGLYHGERDGGSCSGEPFISRCRQTLTVEALGWAVFGLTLVTLIAAWCWARRTRRTYRDTYYV